MAGLPKGVLFIPNPHFEEEYRRSDDCKKLVEGRSAALATNAKAIVADDPRTEVNDLKAGIESSAVLTADGWIGEVRSMNFKGAWFEFGNSRQPPRPYLRRSAEMMGLKVSR